MIQAIATPCSYTNSIYVTFNDDEYVDKYELYRDGVKIAESMNEEGKSDFVRPAMFDHDHGTNLFRKETNHQFMYEDTKVDKFREYAYQVKYYHAETEHTSNIVYATLQ